MRNLKQEVPEGEYRIVKGSKQGVPNRLQFVIGESDLVFNSDPARVEDSEGGVHLDAMTGTMSFRREEVLKAKPATKENLQDLLKEVQNPK